MVAQRQSKRDASAAAPIYVIFGDDRRRVSDTLAEQLESLLAGADPQVALCTYQADAVWADVHDDLRTAPFLSPRRIVMVKDADEFITRYRQMIEDYLESPSTTGVLVMTAGKFPATTRLAKKAAKIGQVFPCTKVSSRELPGYLIDYAARTARLKLTSAAAGTLIELAGEDSGILVGEIDKLAAYLNEPGRSPTIQPADVEQLVGHNRQYNVFAVIDAMLDQNADLALTRLNQMLDVDRDAEYTAVGAFAWHFRRLYAARVMLDRRQDPQAIIKSLRIWSRTDGFIRQVRRFSLRQIAGIIHRLVQIDYASKTGGSTVRSGLEKLIVQLLSTQLALK
jgi:DNA polymerase III subunit delta